MVRCLVVLVFFAGTGDGTTAIVFRSDTFILVGADSLVLLMGQNPGPASGCKIIPAGRFFVVVVGMFGQFVPGGFNAYRLLQDIAKQETTTIAVANRFEKVALKPFQKYLREFQKKDPKDFERACNNKSCLQVLAVDYKAGSPTYAVREFRVVLNHNVPAVEMSPHVDCPGTCTLPMSFDIMGENGEATPLSVSPNFWLRSAASGIDQLIQVEIHAHPGHVGGPISILALDKSGPHWVPGYQGVCPDLK